MFEDRPIYLPWLPAPQMPSPVCMGGLVDKERAVQCYPPFERVLVIWQIATDKQPKGYHYSHGRWGQHTKVGLTCKADSTILDNKCDLPSDSANGFLKGYAGEP